MLLPLLPLGARALAAWFDNSTQDLSPYKLLSDGELLVIATVIAAAIIGDLLFDFSGRNEMRTHTTMAVLCTFALLVVVVSVLMFGLVTLDNQSSSDAEQQAQHYASVQIEDSGGVAFQASLSLDTYNSLVAQENHLNGELGTTRGQERKVLQQHIAALRGEAASAKAQSNYLKKQSATLRSLADQRLESAVSLGPGRLRKQAAIMSLTMFLIAVSAGVIALWFSTGRVEKRHGREAARSSQDGEQEQQFAAVPSEPPAGTLPKHNGETARPRQGAEPEENPI